MAAITAETYSRITAPRFVVTAIETGNAVRCVFDKLFTLHQSSWETGQKTPSTTPIEPYSKVLGGLPVERRIATTVLEARTETKTCRLQPNFLIVPRQSTSQEIEDTLDWDFVAAMPPAKRRGRFTAKLIHRGPSRPMHDSDPYQ